MDLTEGRVALNSRTYLRQYSITNTSDTNNVKNNRCPDYALNWSYEDNRRHWNTGHDYFIGNGVSISDNIELRQILSEKLARGTLNDKIIFCDLDGVLADFEQGVLNKFNKLPNEISPAIMWSYINKSKTFFETLPWMPNGRELWNEIKQYDPIILTGVPRGAFTSSSEQKRRWCARELGPDVHVITCLSKDKPNYCIRNSVLIDDRTDNQNEWNLNGGTFILYHKGEEYLDKILERIHKTQNEKIDNYISSP